MSSRSMCGQCPSLASAGSQLPYVIRLASVNMSSVQALLSTSSAFEGSSATGCAMEIATVSTCCLGMPGVKTAAKKLTILVPFWFAGSWLYVSKVRRVTCSLICWHVWASGSGQSPTYGRKGASGVGDWPSTVILSSRSLCEGSLCDNIWRELCRGLVRGGNEESSCSSPLTREVPRCLDGVFGADV